MRIWGRSKGAVIEYKWDKRVLCGKAQADSVEHILPQCIGGRLSARMLCGPCNNNVGGKVVAQMKRSASIWLALEWLRGDHPDIYDRLNTDGRWTARGADGVAIGFTQRVGTLTDRNTIQPDGSLAVGSERAAPILQRRLQKAGLSDEETSGLLEEFWDLPCRQEMLLPDGSRVIKNETSLELYPRLEPEGIPDRVPALVAFEFLALLVGKTIYSEAFDSVRSDLSDCGSIPSLTVEAFSSGTGYVAKHVLRLEPEGDTPIVEVHLFGWLVFKVTFPAVSMHVPDAVYIEDLEREQGWFAASHADAEAGRWRRIRGRPTPAG